MVGDPHCVAYKIREQKAAAPGKTRGARKVDNAVVKAVAGILVMLLLSLLGIPSIEQVSANGLVSIHDRAKGAGILSSIFEPGFNASIIAIKLLSLASLLILTLTLLDWLAREH